MGDIVQSETARETIAAGDMQVVQSFGINNSASIDDAAPYVMLAVGTEGEFGPPRVLVLDLDMAEQFVAIVQKHIAAARGGKVQ